ncbi:four helix bundle protein [candidate division KSB1 bacterium]
MKCDNLILRTKKFASDCVNLAMLLPNTYLGNHVRGQLFRSSTSVACNYRAVCHAQTKASFISKLSIVIEEADETEYWLDFITDENLIAKGNVEKLLKEASE